MRAGNATMIGNVFVDDKIFNPETGRMVNINGKKGKQVLQQYGGSLVRSPCVKYHGSPIECQAATDEQCFYTRGKYTDPQGVTHPGQCRKFSFKDFEKAKDNSRKRQGLEKQFDKDAAERLYRAHKRNHDPFLRAMHEMHTDDPVPAKKSKLQISETDQFVAPAPKTQKPHLQKMQTAEFVAPAPNKPKLQLQQIAEFVAPAPKTKKPKTKKAQKAQKVQPAEPKTKKPKTKRLKGPCFNKEEDMWAAIGSHAGWGLVNRVAQDVPGINEKHGYADLSKTNKKKVRDYVLDNELQGLNRLEQGCLYTAEADIFTSRTSRGSSKRVGEMCPGKYMYDNDTSTHSCNLRK